jgi:hypothetical protein
MTARRCLCPHAPAHARSLASAARARRQALDVELPVQPEELPLLEVMPEEGGAGGEGAAVAGGQALGEMDVVAGEALQGAAARNLLAAAAGQVQAARGAASCCPTGCSSCCLRLALRCAHRAVSALAAGLSRGEAAGRRDQRLLQRQGLRAARGAAPHLGIDRGAQAER